MGVGCTRCVRQEDGPTSRAAAVGALSSRAPSVPITLHVYDIGSSGAWSMVNRILRPLGTGLFHCGVEVYGWEWSYSFASSDDPAEKEYVGTGVFCCKPKTCEDHCYSTSIDMGCTAMTEDEVLNLLHELEKDWTVSEYHLLTRNCCHFCEDFCLRLGTGAIPRWISTAAETGARVERMTDIGCCKTREGAGRPRIEDIVIEPDKLRHSRPPPSYDL